MKILTLKEFVKLPAGTIYSDYVPDCLTCLFRKEESIGDNDFLYREIVPYNFADGIGCGCRNGSFDDDEQFVVYDGADIDAITKLLTSSEEED